MENDIKEILAVRILHKDGSKQRVELDEPFKLSNLEEYRSHVKSGTGASQVYLEYGQIDDAEYESKE